MKHPTRWVSLAIGLGMIVGAAVMAVILLAHPGTPTYSDQWEEFCQGQTGGMSCEQAEQADEEWARTHQH